MNFKQLKKKLEIFCEEYLRFLNTLTIYVEEKKIVNPYFRESALLSHIKHFQQLLRQVLVDLNQLPELAENIITVLRHGYDLEYVVGEGHWSDQGNDVYSFRKTVFWIGEYNDEVKRRLLYFYHQRCELLDKLDGMRKGMKIAENNLFQDQFVLRRKFKVNKSIITVYIITMSPILEEDKLNTLSMYGPKIRQMGRKAGLLSDCLNNPRKSLELIAFFTLHILQEILNIEPSLVFGSRLNFHVNVGHGGQMLLRSKYHSYFIGLPMNNTDFSDIVAVMVGEKRIGETNFYKVFVHELYHTRDFSIAYPVDERGQVFMENIISNPVVQLIGYGNYLTQIKTEGYATFNDWISSCKWGPVLIFSPQERYVQRGLNDICSSVNNLMIKNYGFPDLLKQIFIGDLYDFDIKKFEEKLRALDRDFNFSAVYSLGALIYTCMFIYLLRKYIGKEIYLIYPKAYYLSVGYSNFKEFISSKAGGQNPLISFWGLSSQQREIMLREKFDFLRPDQIPLTVKSNYLIFTSPKLEKKINVLQNIFSMKAKKFYQLGAKSCEFCGFTNHLFWPKEFLEKVQEDSLSNDQLLEKRAS